MATTPRSRPPRFGRWAKVESRYYETSRPSRALSLAEVQDARRRLRGEHCHVINSRSVGATMQPSDRSNVSVCSSSSGASRPPSKVCRTKLASSIFFAAPALPEVEYSRLRDVFDRLDVDRDGVITPNDFYCAARQQQFRGITKKDAAEILWEVSPFHEPGLNYPALVEVYARGKADIKGVEPKRFYNYLVYSLMDINGNGMITTDEILSCRHSDEFLLAAAEDAMQKRMMSDVDVSVETTVPGTHFVRLMQSGALTALLPEALARVGKRPPAIDDASSTLDFASHTLSTVRPSLVAEHHHTLSTVRPALVAGHQEQLQLHMADFDMSLDSPSGRRSKRRSVIPGVADAGTRGGKVHAIDRNQVRRSVVEPRCCTR